MARHFTSASSEEIITGIGTLAYVGPMTMAGIVRRASDAVAATWFRIGASATNKFAFGIRSTNLMALANGAASGIASTLALTAADGWCFIATTKAAGTASPQFYKYVYSTGVWSNQVAGQSIADPAGPFTAASLGSDTGVTFWDGDIAVAGGWNVVMTSEQLKSMCFSVTPWFQVVPQAFWLLDQAAVAQKVRDLTGHGADESSRTGTTVATGSVPVFSYGMPDPIVKRQPAAGAGGAAGPRDLLLLGAG